MRGISWVRWVLMAATAVSVSLVGCAGQTAMETERRLAAAGFQMKLAQTPELQAQLEAFEPQRELVPRAHDGDVRFVYADAKYCHCLYVGSQPAYRRYQRLTFAKEIVDERRMTAEANEAAAMDWGAWGAWGPWW